MAGIRIFEFADIGKGAAQVRKVPFLASQANATIDGTSRQSSAFDNATRFVSIQADSDCHVLFGANPTATTAGFKIASGSTEDFTVNAGDKVAWISA